MRAIVTGASGFVGRNLTEGLLAAGHRVTAVVRSRDRVPESWNGRAKILCLDLAEIRDLGREKQLVGCDAWFHFAWAGTSGGARGDLDLQLRNIALACASAETADALGCGRFINAGSIMEYEAETYLREIGSTPGGGYIYSTAKLCADLMLRTVCASRQIAYVHAVISNIYGADEVSPRFLNTTLRTMLDNAHIACTEGRQNYDFIHVSDAVRKLIFLGENGADGEDYYIGNPEQRPLKEFILTMHRVSGSRSELGFGEVPFNGPYLDYGRFDPGKLERMGCGNRLSFEDGVKATIEGMKHNG